jgi:nucleoside-diphosphate-sugar epimerase
MGWTILGCGYTGERLAAALLARGERVIATSRSPERAAELSRLGVDGRVVDPRDAVALAAVLEPGDLVVDSVPVDPRGPHTPALVEAAARVRPARMVYLSSTGVYGVPGWIDEDTPARPTRDDGRARLAEEGPLRASGLSVVVLRIAAIYGPGRGLAERLRAGTYRVIGDGATYVSRIHVDDLVAVILAAATHPAPPRDVYVVADDAPATVREHADGVAAALGLPPPPSIAAESAPPIAVEMQTADRRIRNARMKAELGVVLRYPSWRDGVGAS